MISNLKSIRIKEEEEELDLEGQQPVEVSLYNKANDGNAITNKIIAGITVQIISICVLWTCLDGITPDIAVELNNIRILNIIHPVNIDIKIKKNIISWCKSIIPSITSVAGSWKPICQASGPSFFLYKYNKCKRTFVRSHGFLTPFLPSVNIK